MKGLQGELRAFYLGRFGRFWSGHGPCRLLSTHFLDWHIPYSKDVFGKSLGRIYVSTECWWLGTAPQRCAAPLGLLPLSLLAQFIHSLRMACFCMSSFHVFVSQSRVGAISHTHHSSKKTQCRRQYLLSFAQRALPVSGSSWNVEGSDLGQLKAFLPSSPPWALFSPNPFRNFCTTHPPTWISIVCTPLVSTHSITAQSVDPHLFSWLTSWVPRLLSAAEIGI